jgi:hypothetical protein
MLELPRHWPDRNDFHLLHSIAALKVGPEWSIGFGEQGSAADLQFSEELDHWNFRALPAGTVFGKRRPTSGALLSVFDEQEREVTSAVLKVTNDDIILQRSVIPAMLTKNIQVVRDDCLGYFMEEYALPETAFS